MSSPLPDVAEAIKTELDGISLSESVDVVRSYADWEIAADDLDTARIDVVPADCFSVLNTRAKHQYECVVSVVLRKQFSSADRDSTTQRIKNASVDQAVDDLHTIHEYFAPSQPNQTGRELASMAGAAWLQETTIGSPQRRSGVTIPYSRKLLAENSQYVGVVTLVYRVFLAIS